MKRETRTNLMNCIIAALLAVVCFVCLLCGAWWHVFTCAACLLLAWVFYTDSEYGTESVRDYFARKQMEGRV